MKVGLTAEQELLVRTTRRFLRDAVAGDVLRELRHDPGRYRPEYWKAGVEVGWTSLLVSEKHGGGSVSGAGLVDLALVAYEFGRQAAPGPLLGANVVAGALSRPGGEASTLPPDRIQDRHWGLGGRYPSAEPCGMCNPGTVLRTRRTAKRRRPKA
ncbi:acyl-CoA dehydrogenase family protein [Frankia sp. R82]|uniref:acyl-CoA dehydrogenase family protein n=1 Tax=Frankia sp. R82 TaxID=2950553 RepID=UPI0020431D87|nr:acyl-CoA dehydrogenase family protein [Frankia sp. R82]MCM3887370.1 acyl-CoA dehydrogenase family protein [Frankia sp. R82]